MFELVELDPETGDTDQLVEIGTFAQLHTAMDNLLADSAEDWDEHNYPWPTYRIQPAGTWKWDEE